MTPAQLYDLYRAEAFDQEEPFLWSDIEVAAYAELAQEMFVRLTGGIQDATSALTELDVDTGEKWIAYDPKILRIVSATLRSTGRPVFVLNPPELNDAVGKSWSPESINLPGSVCAIVLGLDDASIRVVQVPEADDVIDLVIERLPLLPPSSSVALEVQPQHHYYLLSWMKHLGYLKQDAETFDKAKSDEEGAIFTAYCAQALLEKERRKNKPRLIQYGGIGMTPVTRRW